uniref:NADH-ubiquinone oxidoreductase chain 3 n=1 Tax=Raillietina tetragona TaxID=984823 RepID=A0A0U1Z5C8_9CEST|nr:NADH dehydrogenase subunit 3 [Raillietina tetragona]
MIVLVCGLFIIVLLCGLIYFFCSSLFSNSFVVSSVWCGAYECGFSASSLSFNYFSITYFSLLVFFVIFDLEVSLLLNMPEQNELFDNFVYYNIFLWMLSLGFFLEVLLGYVRWGY